MGEIMGKGKQNFVRRTAAALLLAAMILTLCAGCGADGSKTTMDAAAPVQVESSDAFEMGGNSYSQEESAGEMDSDSATPGVRTGRKLIETVTLEAETKDFEQMMTTLDTQIQELGGYVEKRETYNGSSYSEYRSSRRADLTVRIPQGKLKGFLDTVADTGNIVRRSDNVEDVTLDYVDMESHRDTLRTEQSRLLEFLDQAQTIEEIITIEQRLSEVRYQLEYMESRLRTLDNQVDYSTIHISISEVKELTPVEEPGVWKRISEGFMESLRNVGNGALELGIWFVVHIPYLIIWALIIAGVVVLVKIQRKKKRKKLEELLKKTEAGIGADEVKK